MPEASSLPISLRATMPRFNRRTPARGQGAGGAPASAIATIPNACGAHEHSEPQSTLEVEPRVQAFNAHSRDHACPRPDFVWGFLLADATESKCARQSSGL
jgi:hypothetical protein